MQAIFDHLWRDGSAGTTAAELAGVAATLGIADAEAIVNSTSTKQQLTQNTAAAIEAGVFGVPTLRIGTDLFWGNDASAMVEDWLAEPACFDSDEYRRIAILPVGVERRR